MRKLFKWIFYGITTLLMALSLAYGGICLYWTVQFEKLRAKTIEKGYPQTTEELVSRYGNPLRTPDSMFEDFIRADIGDSIFDDVELKYTEIIAPDSYWAEISANLAQHQKWVEWMDNLPDTWHIPWRIDWKISFSRFRVLDFIKLYRLQTFRSIHEGKPHLLKRILMFLNFNQSFSLNPDIISFTFAFLTEEMALALAGDILSSIPVTDSEIRELIHVLNTQPPYRDSTFYQSSFWIEILSLLKYPFHPRCYDHSPFWMKFFPDIIWDKRDIIRDQKIIFSNMIEDDFIQKIISKRNLLRAGLGIELYFRENGKYPPSLEALVPDYIPRLLENPLSDSPLLFEHGNHLEITVRNLIYDTNDEGWVPDYSNPKKGFYQGFRVWWGDETKDPYDEFRRISGKIYFEDDVQTDSGF